MGIEPISSDSHSNILPLKYNYLIGKKYVLLYIILTKKGLEPLTLGLWFQYSTDWTISSVENNR